MDLDRLSKAMRVGIGKASAPDTDEERGRTEIDESSGPQTLVMILVKALQKAPQRISVNIGSLHQSKSLIDLEGIYNL